MFQNKLSRIGIVVSLLGVAVLGASLYSWTHGAFNRLYYTEEKYEWVRADWSSEPAVKSDEIWLMDAVCKRPYFEKALDTAKKELEAYLRTRPSDRLSNFKSFRWEGEKVVLKQIVRIGSGGSKILKIEKYGGVKSLFQLTSLLTMVPIGCFQAFRPIKRRRSKLIASK